MVKQIEGGGWVRWEDHQARVAELEGDAATVRELIDLLIETCPESREIFKNFAHNVIHARKA